MSHAASRPSAVSTISRQSSRASIMTTGAPRSSGGSARRPPGVYSSSEPSDSPTAENARQPAMHTTWPGSASVHSRCAASVKVTRARGAAPAARPAVRWQGMRVQRPPSEIGANTAWQPGGRGQSSQAPPAAASTSDQHHAPRPATHRCWPPSAVRAPAAPARPDARRCRRRPPAPPAPAARSAPSRGRRRRPPLRGCRRRPPPRARRLPRLRRRARALRPPARRARARATRRRASRAMARRRQASAGCASAAAAPCRRPPPCRRQASASPACGRRAGGGERA
jgi:hypothetical protein